MESQKYKILSGVNSRGFDYEKKISALVALNCLLPENNVQDFWIATNIEDKFVGKFDDVVLCIHKTNSTKKQLYLIQLKHYEEQRRLKKLNYNAFAVRKDFMLEKYAESISIPKKLPKDADYIFNGVHSSEITYILYTNQCTGLEESHQAELKDDVLFKTGGFVYKFKEYGEVKKAFLDKLYVLTDQVNEDVLDKIIFERFKVLCDTASMGMCKKYVTFMENWASGTLGGYRTVAKKEIQMILSELMVTPSCFVRKVRFIDSIVDYGDAREIWKWLVDNHRVVLVTLDGLTEEELHFVASVIRERFDALKLGYNWTKTLTDEEMARVYSTVNQSDIVSTYGSDNISLENVYFTLCRLNQLPLLVKLDSGNSCKNFTRAICLVNKTKYIALLDGGQAAGDSLEFPEYVKRFACMTDLKLDFGHSSRRNFELLFRQTLKLQGRSITLGRLLDGDRDDAIKREIKTQHLVKMFCKNLNVGGDKTNLPSVFIERTIEAVCIGREVLTELANCCIVILENADGDFNSFLAENYVDSDFLHVFKLCRNNENDIPSGCKIALCSTQDNDVDYKNLFMPEKTGTDLHILQLHAINKDFQLEWIKTYGSISEIRSFRLNETINFPVKPNLLNYFDRSHMHVIASSSGMGKTIFLDYLAEICPTDFWILRVNLNEHSQYISKFVPGDPIKNLLYFSNKSQGTTLDEAIFANYLENKKLWLLFDAFDEIVPLCTEKALELIKSVSSYGCRIFVTTRSTAQTFLEDRFNIMARNISSFTMTDQKNYLTKYFQTYVSNIEMDRLHNFVDNLLNMASTNFLQFNNEFLGIPLQMKMMAQIFRDKCASLASTEDVFINLNFIDLLEKFITLKVELYWKEKLQNKDNVLNRLAFEEYTKRSMNNHMLCAVNTFFSKQLDGVVFDEVKEFMVAVQEGKEKTGLIDRLDENGNIIFLHQSILEYFVALWMSQNTGNRNLLLKIFEPEYTTIRCMFDRILARNCPLHLAVLSNNEEAVRQQLLLNVEQIRHKDAAGRTALHLAASWGVRDLSREEEDLEFCRKFKDAIVKEEIFEILVSKCENVDETDCLLEYSPIDYAISSFSMRNVDYLLGKKANFVAFSSLVKRVKPKKLLALCAANNYKNLTENIFALCSNVEVETIKLTGLKDSLLHIAAKSGSAKVIELLSKRIQVDAVNVLQQTALHLAAQYGHSDIIKLLVASGASVDPKDETNATPIQVAARNGSSDAFRALVESGANVGEDVLSLLARSENHVASELKFREFFDIAGDLIKNRVLEETVKNELKRSGDMIVSAVEPVLETAKEIVAEVEVTRQLEKVEEELHRSAKQVENFFKKLW